MPDNLVSRSVFLPVEHDALLRQLAHERGISKNMLIRAAVAAKLPEWLADLESLLRDLRAEGTESHGSNSD